MNTVLQVASEQLDQLHNWWSGLTASKPKGYKLAPAEDAKRRSYVDTIRAAATDAVDDIGSGAELPQALWVLLQLEEFDAVTTGSPKEAVAAAQSAALVAKQLQGMKPDAQTAAHLSLVAERSAFIVAHNGVKPALTWTDSLGCNAAEFWGPCNQNSNWLLWVVGAAAVIWYGRKKKWF